MEINPQTANQLKLNKLCLTRSNQKILHGVDVELPTPGVTVLLGANGAGKSTLLNILAGVTQADSGQIDAPSQNKACLMPEPAVFYPHLTVEEQLKYVAELFGVDGGVASVIDLWQLNSEAKKLTRHLSLGYRQRLSLAQLMVSQADLLLLDEPMNGMDPEVMAVFKQQMDIWRQSKTIIMATHIMHEAQNMADWVVIMHQGQVIQSSAYQHEMSFNELYQNAINQHHRLLIQDQEVASQ